jgi:hypothetical protein
MLAFAVLLLLPLPPQVQDPGSALARYRLLGKEATVSRDDVALEMAFHERRKDEGRLACGYLVDANLIRIEAEKQHLLPTTDEAKLLLADIQRQLRAGGSDPAKLAILRNSSEADLLADLVLPIAHERLVRRELELKGSEEVSKEMLQLWLVEARKRHKVVDDPEQLPLGTAVRIDERDVPLLELGRLLLRKSESDEQEIVVRRLIVLETLEAMAAAAGITVSDAELRSELNARAAAAKGDPRYKGIGYEQLLKAQGMTLAAMLHSRVFRGQLLQRRLVAHQYPREVLLAEVAQDRRKALDVAGARRQVSVIFARALKEPNALVPRDFAAAAAALQKLQARLQKGEDFEYLARVESDDPASKRAGGDIGWTFRKSDSLPEPVLAAAFALAEGAVSAPITASDGVYLVKVVTIEPEPTDDQLIERMREQRIDGMTRQLLTDAAIEMVDAGKPGAK